MVLVGRERLCGADFIRLEPGVQTWQLGWGLTLTTCLRRGLGRDAFVLIAERTDHAALAQLQTRLRSAFPQHVLVLHPYVQGYHLPVYTLNRAGMEKMERHQQRVQRIAETALAGEMSPLLPSRLGGASEVAAWCERTHSLPPGAGSDLLCCACGESTTRQPTEAQAWITAEENGWQTDRERNC